MMSILRIKATNRAFKNYPPTNGQDEHDNTEEDSHHKTKWKEPSKTS
jgi:hypothetical protein